MDRVQQFLLSCGILASLLYLGTDLLASRLLKGYSFTAQSMSELSATGSPTRSVVVPLTLIASILLISFGIGVFRATGQALLPKVVSGLIIGNAIAGLVGTIFFPTRFGERPSFGSANVIIMFLSVVFFILAMVFGVVAFKSWFRILSLLIPTSYIILAALRLTSASASSGGKAVTLIGAQERTMGYSFLLWVLALAIYLLLLLNKGAGPMS